MKHLILTPLLIMFLSIAGWSQVKIKNFEKDSGYLEIGYFPDGKVSTRKLTPKGSYSRIPGYAKAFNLKGKLIFNEPISSLGGSGGVHFQYHANGVIKSANSTFQPDGGIQRHDVTRYFDEQGNFTSERDNSLPSRLTFEEPIKQQPATIPAPTPVKPEVKKTETMECAGIAQMRAYIENGSDVTVKVNMIPNNPRLKMSTFTIQPGERIFCAEYIMAQQFVDPTTYYRFELASDAINQVKLGKWNMQQKNPQLAYFIAMVLPK